MKLIPGPGPLHQSCTAHPISSFVPPRAELKPFPNQKVLLFKERRLKIEREREREMGWQSTAHAPDKLKVIISPPTGFCHHIWLRAMDQRILFWHLQTPLLSISRNVNQQKIWRKNWTKHSTKYEQKRRNLPVRNQPFIYVLAKSEALYILSRTWFLTYIVLYLQKWISSKNFI